LLDVIASGSLPDGPLHRKSGNRNRRQNRDVEERLQGRPQAGSAPATARAKPMASADAACHARE